MAGWAFGVISLVLLIISFMGLAPYTPDTLAFYLGALFAIITIIIGVVNKSKGQIFLGIAGVLLVIFMVLFLTSSPHTMMIPLSS